MPKWNKRALHQWHQCEAANKIIYLIKQEPSRKIPDSDREAKPGRAAVQHAVFFVFRKKPSQLIDTGSPWCVLKNPYLSLSFRWTRPAFCCSYPFKAGLTNKCHVAFKTETQMTRCQHQLEKQLQMILLYNLAWFPLETGCTFCLKPQNPRNWSAGVERRAHVFQTLPVHEVRPGNGDSHMSQPFCVASWMRNESAQGVSGHPDIELCHCGNLLWLFSTATPYSWNLKFNLLLSAESAQESNKIQAKSGELPEHPNNFKHVLIFWSSPKIPKLLMCSRRPIAGQPCVVSVRRFMAPQGHHSVSPLSPLSPSHDDDINWYKLM